jgi:hypothetical protein
VPLPRLEYGSKTPLKWLLSEIVYYKLDTIPMTMATINFANFRNAHLHGDGSSDTPAIIARTQGGERAHPMGGFLRAKPAFGRRPSGWVSTMVFGVGIRKDQDRHLTNTLVAPLRSSGTLRRNRRKARQERHHRRIYS